MNYERDKTEYLTTLDKWDYLTSLLIQVGDEPSVFTAIEVQPRSSRTGLLEERGRWIHRVWSTMLASEPDIVGQRAGWSSLLFVSKGADIQATENRLSEILHALKAEQLKSLCVIAMTRGGLTVKLALVERMFEALGKEWKFGNPELFERWLLDGERYAAALPPGSS